MLQNSTEMNICWNEIDGNQILDNNCLFCYFTSKEFFSRIKKVLIVDVISSRIIIIFLTKQRLKQMEKKKNGKEKPMWKSTGNCVSDG